MSVAHQPLRLLLDEDLSPWVAQRLREDEGVDAVHVRDRGKLGVRDDEVANLAFAEERILVTANVRDFQRIANATEVHAGYIFVMDGALPRQQQRELMARVVAALLGERSMINRALIVEPDGGFRFVELPPET